MSLDITLTEGDGDFPGSAPIVAGLVEALLAGSPPASWEHDIGYNYLVHQGSVSPIAVQAFPYFIHVLNDAPIDTETRESLMHLCAEVFPATAKHETDRLMLLQHIGHLLRPNREWADKVHLLSSYIRVAATDDYLAESLESLLDETCPACGEPVLAPLGRGKPAGARP
jgi:hypothetical protein